MKSSSTYKTGRRPTVTRRTDVRRSLSARTVQPWREWRDEPAVLWSLGILICFIAMASGMILLARHDPMVMEGQIMRDSYTSRIDFDVYDESATRVKRETAKLSAPRFYNEGSAVASIRAALLGLPKAVAGKKSIDEVSAELRQRFALTPEMLTVLSSFVNDQGQTTDDWNKAVDRFCDESLPSHPVIDTTRWQAEQIAAPAPIHVKFDDKKERIIGVSSLLDATGKWPEEVQDQLVLMFPQVIRPGILNFLRQDHQTTFQFDKAATDEAARKSAANVQNEYVRHNKGELLYKRGDALTAEQLKNLTAEAQAYSDHVSTFEKVANQAGLVGLIILLTIALAGYLTTFNARLLRRPRQVGAICALCAVMLGLSIVITSTIPRLVILSTVAPTTLLSIIILVAHDRRMAVAISTFQAVLVCIALDLQSSTLVILLVAIAVAIGSLREIRDRRSLVQAGAVIGAVVAIGAALRFLWVVPMDNPALFWRSILLDGLATGAATGLLVGVFALGILSSIERLFDVTTGLTLVELRDSNLPLLRELHQRAPGTWNHSLQVASIAEAAADAIGANSLLTYVGALYHDIGKMNKPQYFVENQSDGLNKHEKLNPAMSLLLIVGHVKDGMEMAREWGLPKPLHHFIEAHHGTTLVEYFFHVARERAEASHTHDEVKEIEYRYPGPKPRTREVAILMLADAVESASRTLTDTSPTRIEQLVRTLSRKRLLDHQFDDCNLTLRELTLVENSIIKTVTAIRHGRVTYPTDRTRAAGEAATTMADSGKGTPPVPATPPFVPSEIIAKSG